MRRLPACHVLAHARNVLLIRVVRLLHIMLAVCQRLASTPSSVHILACHASKKMRSPCLICSSLTEAAKCPEKRRVSYKHLMPLGS